MTSQTENHCTICGLAGTADIAAWRELGLDQAPNQYTVMLCSNCGLRWLTPIPVQSDLDSLYSSEYFEKAHVPGGSYREKKAQLIPCYRRIAERLISAGIQGGLIDIGCGTGDFLDTAAEYGFESIGVEPSEYACQQALQRGHSVYGCTIHELPSTVGPFSAAHCSHVLEHVPDAHQFMSRVNELLEPSGLLYLEVPLQFRSILDYVARVRGRTKPFSLYSIHHHYFFSLESLKRLLDQHRFEILSLTTFMPCRRRSRPPGPRKWALQSLLWLADVAAHSGDVISVWARRRA